MSYYPKYCMVQYWVLSLDVVVVVDWPLFFAWKPTLARIVYWEISGLTHSELMSLSIGIYTWCLLMFTGKAHHTLVGAGRLLAGQSSLPLSLSWVHTWRPLPLHRWYGIIQSTSTTSTYIGMYVLEFTSSAKSRYGIPRPQVLIMCLIICAQGWQDFMGYIQKGKWFKTKFY